MYRNEIVYSSIMVPNQPVFQVSIASAKLCQLSCFCFFSSSSRTSFPVKRKECAVQVLTYLHAFCRCTEPVRPSQDLPHPLSITFPHPIYLLHCSFAPGTYRSRIILSVYSLLLSFIYFLPSLKPPFSNEHPRLKCSCGQVMRTTVSGMLVPPRERRIGPSRVARNRWSG